MRGNLYIADYDNNRIREVLSGAASYQATPASLDFAATAGGSAPAAQTINLTSSVAGISFAVSASAPWLTVSPAGGSMPAGVAVSADPTGLAAGKYQATITITAPNAIPSITTEVVTLTVAQGTPAALGTDTKSMNFTASQNGSAVTQQMRVLNTGSGPLAFTVNATTNSGGAWLAVASSSGVTTPSAPATLIVTASPGSLAAGTYSGTITITGDGSSVKAPVTLSISAPKSVLLLSQSGLTFTAVAQGGVPLPQSFGILNTGQGSMSWTASAQTLSGGNNWLNISPTSGTVTQPYLDVSLVNVSIDPTGLTAGNYSGRVQVGAEAQNAPQILTVTLNVLPVGANPGPELRPTGLIFTGAAGITPGSQDVTIGNPQAEARSYLSNSIGTAFTYLPTNANVQPSQPANLRVFPDYSKIQPGAIGHGVITLLFDDGTPRTISVLTVVAPSGSNDLNTAKGRVREPAAGSCPSTNLQIQFRSLQTNFVAVIGQATTAEVQIADECGNLIGPSGAAAQATFSNGDGAVNLTHIGNGVWTGTWRPVRGNAGAVTIYSDCLPDPGEWSAETGAEQVIWHAERRSHADRDSGRRSAWRKLCSRRTDCTREFDHDLWIEPGGCHRSGGTTAVAAVIERHAGANGE